MVYINGRFLEEPISGIGKYALCLIKEMDKILPKDKMVLLVSKKSIKKIFKFKNVKVVEVGKFSGNVWEQVELPFYCRDGFLLSLCSRGPIIKKNQLLTVHDAATVITPNRFPWKFRILIRFIYYMLKNRVKTITTVSEQSKKDIIKYYGFSERTIHVVHNGIREGSFDDKIIDKLGVRKKKYILSVGGTENKNLEIIVSALNYIDGDIKYICVGNLCDKYKNLVKDNSRIIQPGYVSDEELLSLYKNACCFVFPSFYEGFGIPPLEAMSMGCPVIASNIAALKEIYGDSAMYCDTINYIDLAHKINLVVSDDLISKKMIEKGYLLSKKYSWEDSALKILSLIKSNA